MDKVVKLSVRQVLFRYLDSLPACKIYGLHLQSTINGMTGKKTFASTLLKYSSDYCQISGATMECTKRQESEYIFTPGAKIAGALDYSKE